MDLHIHILIYGCTYILIFTCITVCIYTYMNLCAYVRVGEGMGEKRTGLGRWIDKIVYSENGP